MLNSKDAPATSAKPHSRRRLVIAGSILALLVAAVIGAVVYCRANYNQHVQQAETASTQITRYSKLSDITFTKDKINVYVFWGDGCIHCEDLYAFLGDVWDEYSQYANLYSFEIWYNEDNDQIEDYLLGKIGKQTGDRSTPTIIIGDQMIQGFNESTGDLITSTIMDRYNHRDSITDLSGVLDLDLSSNGDSSNDDNGSNEQ